MIEVICTAKPIGIRINSSDMLDGGLTESDALEVVRMLFSLSKKWINEEVDDISFPRFRKTVPGGMTAWYTMKQIALAKNEDSLFDMNLSMALQTYEALDASRVPVWKRRFNR